MVCQDQRGRGKSTLAHLGVHRPLLFTNARRCEESAAANRGPCDHRGESTMRGCLWKNQRHPRFASVASAGQRLPPGQHLTTAISVPKLRK
jgi:hypothetical protein